MSHREIQILESCELSDDKIFKLCAKILCCSSCSKNSSQDELTILLYWALSAVQDKISGRILTGLDMFKARSQPSRRGWDNNYFKYIHLLDFLSVVSLWFYQPISVNRLYLPYIYILYCLLQHLCRFSGMSGCSGKLANRTTAARREGGAPVRSGLIARGVTYLQQFFYVFSWFFSLLSLERMFVLVLAKY